jgi:hypothetical protein
MKFQKDLHCQILFPTAFDQPKFQLFRCPQSMKVHELRQLLDCMHGVHAFLYTAQIEIRQ